MREWRRLYRDFICLTSLQVITTGHVVHSTKSGDCIIIFIGSFVIIIYICQTLTNKNTSFSMRRDPIPNV